MSMGSMFPFLTTGSCPENVTWCKGCSRSRHLDKAIICVILGRDIENKHLLQRLSHLRCESSSCSYLSPGNYNSGSSQHGVWVAGNKSVQFGEGILREQSPAQEFIPFKVWDLILFWFIQQAVTQNGIHLYKAAKQKHTEGANQVIFFPLISASPVEAGEENFQLYSLFVCFINQLITLHIVNDDVSHLTAWEDAAFSKDKENF